MTLLPTLPDMYIVFENYGYANEAKGPAFASYHDAWQHIQDTYEPEDYEEGSYCRPSIVKRRANGNLTTEF